MAIAVSIVFAYQLLQGINTGFYSFAFQCNESVSQSNMPHFLTFKRGGSLFERRFMKQVHQAHPISRLLRTKLSQFLEYDGETVMKKLVSCIAGQNDVVYVLQCHL